MLNDITVILVKLDELLPQDHALATRLTSLMTTIPKVIVRFREIEQSVAKDVESSSVIQANYSLTIESKDQEVTILHHLCTLYKILCGGNKVVTPAAVLPSEVDDHILAIEAMIHEIETIRIGIVSDAELIQWSLTQLDAWKILTGTCDTTAFAYEIIFKEVLQAHPSLLGRTIKFPCLSDRQQYVPFKMIAFPMPLRKELWQVPIDKQSLLMFATKIDAPVIISEDDLLPVYPNTNLPIYDGNGLARQPAPSYLADTIPLTKISEPEACPAQVIEDPTYPSTAMMTAVSRDSWIVTNYRSSTVSLVYRKGAKQHTITIPKGIHVLQLLASILMQPSSESFQVHQKLRMTAQAYYFNSDPLIPVPDVPFEKDVIFIPKKQEKDIFGLDISSQSWREPLALSFAFMFLLACLLVITFVSITKCKGWRKHLRTHRRKNDSDSQSFPVHNVPMICPPSMQTALVPYLHRVNSSQW
jgi:hypothetical protein